MNLYKELWSRIGGRPYTFIIRDFVYENPWLFVLLSIFIILWFLNIKHEILYIMFGFLLGHLFWGTKWIHEEKGE